MPCVQPQRADGLLLSLLGRTGAVDNPKSVTSATTRRCGDRVARAPEFLPNGRNSEAYSANASSSNLTGARLGDGMAAYPAAHVRSPL